MYDPTNPYASPSAEIHPVAAQWLGQPSPSLERVANGLAMILAGNLLMLGLMVFIIGAVAIIRDPASLETVVMIIGLGSLLALGLHVAGSLFCLATPTESGAKGIIVVSFAATILAVLLNIGIRFGAIRDVSPQVINLLNLVAGITFLIFLRLLSRFIGRFDLGRTAISILVWGVISTIAAVAGVIMIIASLGFALLRALAEHQPQAEARLKAALQGGAAGGALIGFLIVFAAVIIALVTYVRYLILLHSARRAILTGGRG